MTSEQRRYERLLERQLRGLPLQPDEALELARHQAVLPIARREQAALTELAQWFTRPPSESEKQTLTRLERAALVRARHNSRASLRLLTSDDKALAADVRRNASTAAWWREALRFKRWHYLAVALVFGSAGALAFGGRPWHGLFERASNEQEQNAPAPTEVAFSNSAPIVHLSPAPEPDSRPVTNVAPNVEQPVGEAESANERRVDDAPNAPHSNAARTSRSSPGDLLAEAREALRQNDAKRALARYRELVRRYPTSSEATSVRVTVAQLELQTGSTKRALAGFDRYLEHGGSLGPEALAGKVQALSALGHHAQAKSAMREYLTRFPNEVYSKGYRRALEQ